jgi:hypothetical protein
MHLDCGYVNAKVLINFFDISKYVFWVEGAYAPRSRIKFPIISCVHLVKLLTLTFERIYTSYFKKKSG